MTSGAEAALRPASCCHRLGETQLWRLDHCLLDRNGSVSGESKPRLEVVVVVVVVLGGGGGGGGWPRLQPATIQPPHEVRRRESMP